MNKILIAATLLALSSVAQAEPEFVHWSLTLHELVGPHPGADFYGTMRSGAVHFTDVEFIARPPNIWVATPSCCDIVLEGVQYGDSHLVGFMVNQPTFDHDLLFDSVSPVSEYAPDLWFGLGNLPDGSVNPIPYFQLADGSISGLYELHRVSEPATIVVLMLLLSSLLVARWKK